MDTHRNPWTGAFSWISLKNKILCLFWKARYLLDSPENKGLDYSEANKTGKGKARLLQKITFRHTFSLSLQRVVYKRFIILNYHLVYTGNKSPQISTWNRKKKRKEKKKVISAVPGCDLGKRLHQSRCYWGVTISSPFIFSIMLMAVWITRYFSCSSVFL